MSTAVEQIKDRLDIVDIVSSYIKLEKSGVNWRARCPFHNEKSPSFFVSPNRQSFFCFGCGAKGDIFSFVEQFEGLDFKGALKTLADRAGVDIKQFRTSENPEEKDDLFKVMEEATKIYEKNLKTDSTSLQYLNKRGMKDSTISKWRIGLAFDGWRNLYDELQKKGFSKKNLLETGLIKKVEVEAHSTGSGQEKYYDTFRDRIMFPILDSAGRVVAFSGRTRKKEEENPNVPKYLNSPETKLFYKSDILYGFNLAKNYIRKLDYSVLVEGQMDLVLSHQAGVANTVASSGTALTELHLKKIGRLSNRVIIGYDSDKAGEAASKKAALLALSLGMEVKIATLEEGEDPASIIKKDPEIWKEALRNSKNAILFFLDRAAEKNKDAKLAKDVRENVLPLLAAMQSEIEKSQLLKQIALKLGVGEEAVFKDLQKIKTAEDSRKKGEIEEKPRRSFEEEREILLFEAERYGIKIDKAKNSEEILKRIGLQKMKDELQKKASLLDRKNISESEEASIRKEIETIQKEIKRIQS